MYVPVPRYVNFDGFSAMTRRSIGATLSDPPVHDVVQRLEVGTAHGDPTSERT